MALFAVATAFTGGVAAASTRAATSSGGNPGGSSDGTAGGTSGGAGLGAPAGGSAGAPAGVPSTPAHPTVPGFKAKIIHGIAYAPSYAPIQVQRAIWAGNAIRLKPYIYGGGHGKWKDAGYDCSGSVSYVLHAAGLLSVSKDSSDFMSWGQSGLGHWITVFTNPGHAFVEIAGIRLDTSSEGDLRAASGSGPRWRSLLNDTSSYMERHPVEF